MVTRRIIGMAGTTVVLAALGLASSGAPESAKAATPPFVGIVFNDVYRYNSSASHYMEGDSFGTAWADDNKQYMMTCDPPYEWNGAGTSHEMTVNVLPDNPQVDAGSLVNGLTFLGAAGSTTGGDLVSGVASWKGCSILSEGGALYMEINRQKYQWQSDNPYAPQYQWAISAGILKSTDHGATWIDDQGNVNAAPSKTNMMFNSQKFNSFYFIQHGQDNTAPSGVAGPDTYVYAMSTGLWPDGTPNAYLGRVLKSQIMNRSAWSFYDGPPPTTGSEGTVDSNWTSNPDSATPILTDAGKLNWGDVYFDASLQKYVYASYYFPEGYTSSNDPNRYHGSYAFFQSDAPWGPWSALPEVPNSVGYYIPTILEKSSDGLNFTVAVNGAYDSQSWQNSTYTMYIQKAQAYTDPALMPLQVDDNAQGTGLFQASYSGSWGSESRLQDYSGGDHYSPTAGDTVSFSFRGTGITVRGQKAHDKGILGVSLDGGSESLIDAYNPNTTDTTALYSVSGMAYGNHTVTIRVTGTKNASSAAPYINVDRFDVFGSGASVPISSTKSYTLINKSTGQAMSVSGDSLANTPNAPVLQWPDNGWSTQRFGLSRNSDGMYVITNSGSAQSVDVNGSAPNTSGTGIVQYPYNGWGNQSWTLHPVGIGYYRIDSTGSGMSLASPSTATGAQLVQETTQNSDSELWVLVPGA